MAESGIVRGGNLGVGNFEFSTVHEVSTADAARRARERVELVDLLSRFAGAAPDLCCEDLDGECCSGQARSCDCDRPGPFEGFGDGPGHRSHPQSDCGHPTVRSVGGNFFDSVDHAR